MKNKTVIKHIDLNGIENPNFLHELSYKEMAVLSDDIRQYIIDMVSKNGGHLSSNLGVVDATIALCRCFDFTKDKIIFDVGHQSYTYKILTGRSLERLRKRDGVSGFQKMNESSFDHYEAGHSSTSISAALGIATARDLHHEKYDVIAFVGDGSIANGLSFEGLNNLSHCGHKVIIIFNDNDMSINKPVGGLARSFRNLSNSLFYRRSKHAYQRIMKTTGFGRWLLKVTSRIKNWFKRHLVALNIFDYLDLSYIGPIDGHNIKDLEKAINKAKKIENSVVVHIKTLKGKGFAFAENDEEGSWHGVGAFNKDNGSPLNVSNNISWSKEIENCLDLEMGKHSNSILIVPATESGSELMPLFKKYPSRCVDVGIAEEHAVTFASGLAVNGCHPIISIYSTFLQRAYDEVIHDLARMNLNATILIDRAGLVGADGDTHQGIYDEAYLQTIPGTVIAMPSRACEAQSLVSESFNGHGVFCVRFPREACLTTSGINEPAQYAKWKLELNSGDTAIVSVGPATLELKEYIIENNIKATLYNAIYLKPMDEFAVRELLKHNKIIIYDRYGTKSGFAQLLAAHLMELSYQGKVIIKAIPDAYVRQGTIKEQIDDYHLSIEEIANSI